MSRFVLLVFVLVAVACQPRASLPQPPAPPPTTVTAPAGSAVQQKEQAGAQRLLEQRGNVQVDNNPATVDTVVSKDALIVTGANGYTVLTLQAGSAIAVGPNTHVRLGQSPSATWSLRLVAGTLLSAIPAGASYEVVTDNAVAGAGVQGARFYAEAEGPTKSYLCACHGGVQMVATPGTFNDTVQAGANNPHRGYAFSRNQGAVSVAPAAQHNHGTEEEQIVERWTK